jgi:hypothetical protein
MDIQTVPAKADRTYGTHHMRFRVTAESETHAGIIIGKSASRRRLSWCDMTKPVEVESGVWTATVLYIVE